MSATPIGRNDTSSPTSGVGRPGGRARVGTSGWRYPSWRGDFYPQGLRQREELAYLAGQLTAVEINGSFYSLQRPSSYTSWAGQVPVDFVFAVKGGFHSPRARDLLQRNGIAMVVSDSAGTWPQFDVVTSDLVYVRLHGDTELYRSGYSEPALESRAGRVRRWTEDGLGVHVYFDNDARGHAPHDARALLDLLHTTPGSGRGAQTATFEQVHGGPPLNTGGPSPQ